MVVVTTAFLLTATHAVTSLWRLIDRHTDRHTDRQVERQTERARETKLMATVRRTIDDNLQSPKTGSSIPITVDVHCRSYICVSIASAHDVAFTLYRRRRPDSSMDFHRKLDVQRWMSVFRNVPLPRFYSPYLGEYLSPFTLLWLYNNVHYWIYIMSLEWMNERMNEWKL